MRFRKGDSYQLKAVAHDMDLSFESSGIWREAIKMYEQFPSFASEFKVKQVLYGVAKNVMLIWGTRLWI